MEQTVIMALFNNAALLLVLSVIYEITYSVPIKYRRLQPIFNGLLISLICIAIMSMPFTLQPGVIYDTRSILISATALIFGPIPTLITVVVAAAYRLSLGGPGIWPGLAVIISSALIGLAWRRWLNPKTMKWRWLNIYAMSTAVHITMLFCMLLLPYPNSITVIRTISVPVMLIYPIASVILNLLLMRQQERRGIQEQLKQSEERFRILFDKAPLGYQSLDLDGNFIDVNQQWLDTLGYSREEVIGKWFGDFIAPEYREVFHQRFTLFKAKGRIHSEFEMLHKNGQKLFIAFEGKVGYGYDGSFKQTHCILQDITEQKAAEDKLRESEEKYRRLFETMAQGVVYQRADGSIISVNPAAERILGMTLEQILNRTSMDPIWQSIREDGSEMKGFDHPVMVALRTGEPVGPLIMGVFRPDINDHVWLSINAIPIFRPGETTPYQAYATFQDITAERKAKQNYQLLFDKMVDAFALHEIICNDQGEPIDYKFLAINPSFENMTGLKADYIIGKTVLEVMPDTENYWIQTYGRVALTGEPIKFENYSNSTGKYFAVSAYRPALKQFACSFSDETERMRVELALRESEEKYSSYIRNAPDGIFVVDNNGAFIEVNKAAVQITGYSEEELLTMKTMDITAEEYMETSAQMFGSIFATGFASGELQFVHKDGSKKWMSIAAVRLSENRLLGFVSDITNKKMQKKNLLI